MRGQMLDGGELNLCLTSRNISEPAEVSIDTADRAILSYEHAQLLTGSNTKAAKSFEDGDMVKAMQFEGMALSDGLPHCGLSQLSFLSVTPSIV